MAEDKPDTRFAALYDGARPAVRRPGSSGVDLLAGLLARFVLAAQFWTWGQANALPVIDAMDWRAWITPEPGLVAAARIWTQNQFDPELTAMLLLAAALLMTASLALGFLTRLAGLAAAAGALWHIVFILPEAWPTTLAWGALGLYLALRGAGPASLDWMAARLARLG
ncbi:MAG: hypothetical protein LAT81_02505 [Oceanicaulis sp.]|nr:hypothetical protein [Oceanicaulis sp.]